MSKMKTRVTRRKIIQAISNYFVIPHILILFRLLMADMSRTLRSADVITATKLLLLSYGKCKLFKMCLGVVLM